MVSVGTARAFSRSLLSTSRGTSRTTANRTKAQFARQNFCQQWQRRGYADSASPKSGGSSTIYWLLSLGALVGGGGYYYYTKNSELFGGKSEPTIFVPGYEDYEKVYNAIAKRLEEYDEYEDGSYGPVVLRLAWHASGTYDKATNTGGSNGATMRFAPESDHGANAGLKTARDFLEPIHNQFPWITYSDLWTLAGVTAVQEMQGPLIPWRPGRSDRDVSYCTPDGRLPDGAKGAHHLRAIFGRMGWNDQEIVALSGAHALGRCHSDRSGFDGPWTFSPTVLTNDYFKFLLDEKWNWRKWNGPKQYQDTATKSLMMLPTDMALIQDKKLRPWVEKYAEDNEAFFKDFQSVAMRLFELGVPFTSEEKDRWTFKPLATV